MNKFEDVDVIASLEAIMKQNTAFYQNDFDLDRNILQKAAASPTAEDRRLLWFSRPSGTSCFRERDVFLKGTRQHNTCGLSYPLRQISKNAKCSTPFRFAYFCLLYLDKESGAR